MIEHTSTKIALRILSIIHEALSPKTHVVNIDSPQIRGAIAGTILPDGNEWSAMLARIRDDFAHSPIPTSRFLEYSSIRGPLHPNQQWLGTKYLRAIAADAAALSDGKAREIARLLIEEPFGSPQTAYCYPSSSPITIQHVYHLLRLGRSLKVHVSAVDEILEFGGGYGNLARLIFKAGFRGRYKIYDFEVMHKIQKYYLENCLPANVDVQQIEYCSSSDGLRATKPEGSLFLATWSLSESPLHVREEFLELIAGHQYVLMTFQREWHDIDNLGYFRRLPSVLPSHECAIEECPVFKGNYYFFARRK